MQNKCDELVAQVRQNQHGFDNHMMAVFATHYTCTTYEELVQVQKEYCGLLKEENKYNRLLLLGNKILSGFLFAKFEEWEKKGIVYHYKIKTEVNNCRVSYFYLIEMLGVLLDNAAEAVCSSGGSEEIYLEVDKMNTKYIFKVANTCNEVSYTEMQNWFKLGKSSKGSERGIGLFGLKKRTEEYDCKLHVENEKIGSRNWIVFRMAVEEGGK